jgi:hypothetical protein
MSIKKRRFYVDLKFIDASFQKCAVKSLKQKTTKKCAKTKILKIRIVFQL